MIPGGYCRDCKWWTQLKDLYHWHKDLPGEPTARCDLTEDAVIGGPGAGRTKAIARDDEWMHAELQTMPDFGCVQFEANQ